MYNLDVHRTITYKISEAMSKFTKNPSEIKNFSVKNAYLL